MRTKLFLIMALLTAGNAFAQAYPDGLFAVTKARINEVREPHGMDWYLQSKEANVIRSAVATDMGINPKFVSLALQLAPKVEVKGEDAYYNVPLASNYAFCSAYIGAESLVPAGPTQAAAIDARTTHQGLVIYTWTPVKIYGEGSTWVKADVEVIGIKPEYLSEFRSKGICKEPIQRAILKCKGNPCSPIRFGKTQNVGGVVPPLK